MSMWELLAAFLLGFVIRPMFDAILNAAKAIWKNAKNRYDDESK